MDGLDGLDQVGDFSARVGGGLAEAVEGTMDGDAVMFVKVCQWFGPSEGILVRMDSFFACIPHLSEA